MSTLSPVPTLIQRAMLRHGWRRSLHLHAALADNGVDVSLQTVLNWRGGKGVDDKHRPGVARTLGVSLEALILAVGGIGDRDEEVATDPADGDARMAE